MILKRGLAIYMNENIHSYIMKDNKNKNRYINPHASGHEPVTVTIRKKNRGCFLVLHYQVPYPKHLVLNIVRDRILNRCAMDLMQYDNSCFFLC